MKEWDIKYLQKRLYPRNLNLYIYINSDNKQNLEVVRFDKSEIGFLNGKEMEYQKVLEIPLDK